MTPTLPRARGMPAGRAVLRSQPEDFEVSELPGFELAGTGEHVYLHVEKRRLNTLDVVQRIARLSGAAQRDIGYSGLKDRNAVARQWFSVGMAGRTEPDWTALETAQELRLLATGRHLRKLRRGTHRGNRFRIRLRALRAERADLEQRLHDLRDLGAPNYFGEQRFGRGGATLTQAQRWAARGGRVSRDRRGLYLSALRAQVFNTLLAGRVQAGTWDRIVAGDICMLSGSRSYFTCAAADADIEARLRNGDIHPGLPLWGADDSAPQPPRPVDCADTCAFLESVGVALAWRPARLLPDDFCWQFCDDDCLQLDFVLGAGCYATALLAELLHYTDGSLHSGNGSEQG